MPSNVMYACTDCRVGGKHPYPACVAKGHKVICLGKKITIPKKNNARAWKRISEGEYKWNRRKTRGNRGKDTYTVYEYEYIPIEPDPEGCECNSPYCNANRVTYSVKRIPGSGREVINPRRKPDVDLGG